MRQKKFFVLIILLAVILTVSLGIGAGMLHKSLINGGSKEEKRENVPPVSVDITEGQTDEKMQTPFSERNGLKNGPKDEKVSAIPKNDKTGQNEPSDAREGHGASGESVAENIFTESGREVVHFDYCKDGDTIVVTKGSGESVTVRLIGINTPESVAPEEYTEKTGKENNDYGKMASDYAKGLFKDTDILYLEYDSERTDTYGRTLAYVYFDDTGDLSDMVNAKLLSDGYASVMCIEPNTRYAVDFQALFYKAREERLGLWQDEVFFAGYDRY